MERGHAEIPDGMALSEIALPPLPTPVTGGVSHCREQTLHSRLKTPGRNPNRAARLGITASTAYLSRAAAHGCDTVFSALDISRPLSGSGSWGLFRSGIPGTRARRTSRESSKQKPELGSGFGREQMRLS
jgi:hypothetical protein